MRSNDLVPALLILSALALAPGAAGEVDALAAKQAAVDAERRAGEPGPAHAALAELAGRYRTVSRLVYGGQPAGPETAGSARLSMTLGGRFLLEENDGEMMGSPVTGWRLIGYNQGTGRYEGVAAWSLATGLLSMSGASADGGRTMVFDATYRDETGQAVALAITLARRDADHFTLEVAGTGPDPAQNAVNTVEYTRLAP